MPDGPEMPAAGCTRGFDGVNGGLAATAGGLRGGLAARSGAERSGAARYALELIATAAACYVAARIGLELAYPHHGGSPIHGAFTAFWPPIGVGIAALVLFGPRLWPGVVAG